MLTHHLFIAVIPLYIMIVAGYVAGRYVGVQSGALSRLVIFVIVPVAFSTSVATLPWQPAWLLLPVMLFAASSLIAVLIYYGASMIFVKGDTRINLAAMAAGTGNTGYFGLPIFIMLYGEQYVGAYMLGVIGISISESTVCYYLLCRGQASVQDSLKRLYKMPALYACAVGIALNMLGVGEWPVIKSTLGAFKGAYIVCGMMVVGAGLSSGGQFVFDGRLTGLLFGAKFIVWPLLAMVIGVGVHSLGIVPLLALPIIAILSVVPLAANTVAFATYMNIHPEKAALVVLLSTIMALPYIPLALPWLLRLMGSAIPT
jgi:malate permease and related proteins